MAHHITADHLVDVASKAVTEELFREFDRTLQSFCNEEQDRIAIFRFRFNTWFGDERQPLL